MKHSTAVPPEVQAERRATFLARLNDAPTAASGWPTPAPSTITPNPKGT